MLKQIQIINVANSHKLHLKALHFNYFMRNVQAEKLLVSCFCATASIRGIHKKIINKQSKVTV